MGIGVGRGGKGAGVRSAFIGRADAPVWSVTMVPFNTVQYMTREAAVLYDAWGRWPIDDKGAFIEPTFTGTAWALFGSYDGMVYWKPQGDDRYLNEFTSAQMDEAEGTIEVRSKGHRLSKTIPETARRIRKGYIGIGGKARLFYYDEREGDEV